MGTMSPLPADHPVLVAWLAWKATEGFSNTKRWAARPEYVDSSLWAAFYAGSLAMLERGDADSEETSDDIATLAGWWLQASRLDVVNDPGRTLRAIKRLAGS